MQSLTKSPDSEKIIDAKPSSRERQECFQKLVPDYALLFFDHLHSEYLTLRSGIKEQPVLELLDSIYEKRLKSQLTWSDIYTFDLALIDERPLENLVRKAYDARAKYRSIAGQKEFDEYVASKPPDLTSILIAPQPSKPSEPAAPGQPDDPQVPVPLSQSSAIIQRVLRADIRYLLSKFYLYYAMLPMREDLRDHLTGRAVRLTLIVLGIIVVLILISVGGILISNRTEFTTAFGLTVGSVAFAGIVGGCVSMLQRIQSAPSEGDALFNLAALTNGWRGLSLSPLYGGIFASLLFILFAAGVLEGSIFPKINTPGKEETQITSSAAAAAPATQQSTTAAPSTEATTLPTSAVATPTPLTATQRTGILQVKDFLKDTGPKDGVSFALLIIWSFIAGFAERLVPDTLNRLVAKNEAIQGTNT